MDCADQPAHRDGGSSLGAGGAVHLSLGGGDEPATLHPYTARTSWWSDIAAAPSCYQYTVSGNPWEARHPHRPALALLLWYAPSRQATSTDDPATLGDVTAIPQLSRPIVALRPATARG